jgi:hypothetical protein
MQRMMQASVFCLVPAGDSCVTSRLFTAIINECIPIVICEQPVYYFEQYNFYKPLFIKAKHFIENPNTVFSIINKTKDFVRKEQKRLKIAKETLLYTGKHIGINILSEAFSFVYRTLSCSAQPAKARVSKKCSFGKGMVPWRFPDSISYYNKDTKFDANRIPVTHQKTERHEYGLWYYVALGCSDVFLHLSNPLIVRNKMHALHFLKYDIQQSKTAICEASYNIKQQAFSITNEFDNVIFELGRRSGYDAIIFTHQPQGNGKSLYPEILDLRIVVRDTRYNYMHKAVKYLTDSNGSNCNIDCWAECCLYCTRSITSKDACMSQKKNKNNKCFDVCKNVT